MLSLALRGDYGFQESQPEVEMIDLSRLVEAPATTLRYIDRIFPDRPLVLQAARPRH